jgi:nicotinamidase-related amidase
VCSCWPGVTRRYRDRPDPLEGHEIVDEVAPQPGEVVVDKYGYGSFHNTMLEDALRAAGAGQVWVVGTVTQICVEETVREGFHRGFELVVAADGVSSFDDELHRATLRNLAHKFAVVSDTVALTKAAIDAPRPPR